MVIEIKKAYLKQVIDEPKPRLTHDTEVEECDQDLTRADRKPRTKKPTIRRKWIEKDTFDWGPAQQEAFDKVKQAIYTNAMAGADPNLQYHLATDASMSALGGCLFQIRDAPPGTEATPTIALNERIIMFLSYRLNNTETRYSNSERECLAIVKSLAEVRWLIIGNKYPVIIYTDHEALKPIFATGQTEKGRVATWLDRLGEFDTKVVHRPSRDQHIGLADGLS